MDAFLVDCVRSQVNSFLAEIRRVEEIEFPYQHSADCVSVTLQLFKEHRDLLAGLDAGTSPQTVDFVCETALADVVKCLPLIGFLVRSTNVRNAFEAYGPLLRLSVAALDAPDTKLVISSEWDFSPFTYIGFQHLPGAVLIGLPATESSNPLLLPLAGHELGHNVWRGFSLEQEFSKTLITAILKNITDQWGDYEAFMPGVKKSEVSSDLIARLFWSLSYDWALNQTQEYFCDVFGVRLFGESFPHAFAYLLAPFRSARRVPHYPLLEDRGAAIAEACKRWQIPARTDYQTLFKEQSAFKSSEKRELAQLDLADGASRSVLPLIYSKVEEIMDTKHPIPNLEEKVDSNLARFALLVPANNAGGIAHILNAAWRMALQENPAELLAEKAAKRTMLCEMVWKSIEIDEIEHRLALP